MSETEKNTPRTRPDLSQADLLGLLCQIIGDVHTSGLRVRSGNHAGSLVIVISGAERLQDDAGVVRFVPAVVPVVPVAEPAAQPAPATA